MTKILPCTCQHVFQNRTYGQGKRLHNQTMKGWRCTVCENEKIERGAVVVSGSTAK